MIEVGIAFALGFGYAVFGFGIESRVRDKLTAAMPISGALWGTYASMMVVLLWPVLAVLILLSTGYAAVSGVSE